jgi:hypothetical protein
VGVAGIGRSWPTSQVSTIFDDFIKRSPLSFPLFVASFYLYFASLLYFANQYYSSRIFASTESLAHTIMPGIVSQPQTLYDKVFNDHVVNEADDGTILLYIGKHIVYFVIHVV